FCILFYSLFGNSSIIFPRYVVPPGLPSVPTRRSSDLAGLVVEPWGKHEALVDAADGRRLQIHEPEVPGQKLRTAELAAEPIAERSEEHTSELQSRENLVCRLLLEKKKSSIPIVTSLAL